MVANFAESGPPGAGARQPWWREHRSGIEIDSFWDRISGWAEPRTPALLWTGWPPHVRPGSVTSTHTQTYTVPVHPTSPPLQHPVVVGPPKKYENPPPPENKHENISAFLGQCTCCSARRLGSACLPHRLSLCAWQRHPGPLTAGDHLRQHVYRSKLKRMGTAAKTREQLPTCN